MRAFDACRARWACSFLVAAAAVAFPVSARAADPEPVSAASAGQLIRVHLDQARIVKLPARTATLVVGNPLIADAVVQPGGIVVVTAKGYGATNLVALDSSGVTLMETSVQVTSPNEHVVVTLYRGVERETYSCGPECGRRMTIGDSPAFFTQNLTQIGTVNAIAQQQAK
jgi:Flp pilus assembly secretin CpaC